MNKYDRGAVCGRIKALRKKHRYTQKDMAKKMALAYNTYVKIENGYYNLTVENLIAIAGILETSADYLLFGIDREGSYPPERLQEIQYWLDNIREEGLQKHISALNHLLDLKNKKDED